MGLALSTQIKIVRKKWVKLMREYAEASAELLYRGMEFGTSSG